MRWDQQFSEISLRYSRLQSVLVPSLFESQSRAAEVAHLSLLIVAVSEDRLLDGQVNLDRELCLFLKQLEFEAFAVLDALVLDFALFKDFRLKRHRQYASAQSSGYDTITSRSRNRAPRSILKIASGRASYGILAPVALLMAGGATEQQIRTAVNAFDCLVTGMQYVDDMKDWREDVRTGDENLLLVALRASGRDPYAHPPNELREPNIGHALVESGAFDTAATAAQRWFQSALRRQELLGCHELADLIRKRIEAIEPLKAALIEGIRAEVTATAARIAANASPA